MAAERIDFHVHCMPDAYRDAILASPIASTARIPEWSFDAHVEFMDRNEIDVSVLSLAPPGIYFGDPQETAISARRCNDELAEIVAKGRGRFRALGVAALPNVAAACDEVAYTLDVLKFDGVSLFTSYDGVYLGARAFDPVLSALHDRQAVAFIHPNIHPANGMIQLDWPAFVIEYPFDTARAATNLIFSGAMDRYSSIRFVLAHGGGALPALAYRLAAVGAYQLAKPPYVEKFPLPFFTDRPNATDPDAVTERIRRFWFEVALSAGPSILAALKTLARPERILFGSDWPYAPASITTDVLGRLAAEFPEAAKLRAVERDNAVALLGGGTAKRR